MGFFPLSWDEQSDSYIQFPGEIWQGKTWIEQNQIIGKNTKAIRTLLDSVPGSIHLRYLTKNSLLDRFDFIKQDEIGYLFFPGIFDFSFDKYLFCFSGKSRKKIKNELQKLEEVSFRINSIKDLEHMFAMNIDSFSENSYFSDARFYDSFERLASFLMEMGMLRITTILVGGKIAAVDMGAIFKNTYTLLAGGTNPEFPGIAKLINLHHLEWSCQKKFDTVDFLCGDFNWKERFHLSPRPLYEINIEKTTPFFDKDIYKENTVCV